jgi:hypothetical protein
MRIRAKVIKLNLNGMNPFILQKTIGSFLDVLKQFPSFNRSIKVRKLSGV